MKDFFEKVVAHFFAILVAYGIILAGLILFFTVLLTGILSSFAVPDGKPVGKRNVLTLDLATYIPDTPQTFQANQVVGVIAAGGLPYAVHLLDAVRAIDTASQDDAIAALYIDGSHLIGGLGASLVNALELRAAIERFAQSGKPVYAYLHYPTLREYLVASAATNLAINPDGRLLLPGLAFEVTYWAELFERLGIHVQLIHQGDFKATGETFTRTEMSPEERTQLTALLDDVWARLCERIGSSRGISASEVARLSASAPAIDAELALERGLIDEALAESDFIARLDAEYGASNGEYAYARWDLIDYVASLRTEGRWHNGGGTVAVVYLDGEIIEGAGDTSVADVGVAVSRLRDVRTDPAIDAVVLRVNSPGGSASGAAAIYQEIEALAREKPLVASVGAIAASGGYLAVAPARKIFADEASITGSIGVVLMIPNIEALTQKAGLNVEVVKTSPSANIYSLSRPRTEEEMAFLRASAADIYARFLARVAVGRGLTIDELRPVAGGRIWSGTDALGNGLVDATGGIRAAIDEAASLAGLGPDYTIREFPSARGFEEFFADLFATEAAASRQPGLQSELWKLLATLQDLSRLTDPQGIYLLTPFQIELE